jgi:formyltetrahydrofolate deformylase
LTCRIQTERQENDDRTAYPDPVVQGPPGIVSGVTGKLFESGANILEAQQFDDALSGNFFMRVVLDPGAQGVVALREAFRPVAEEFAMDWRLRDSGLRRRVILMVSRFDHCLGDLLYRARIGELAMDVVAIIGNHPREALSVPLWSDIPYYHLPVTAATKPAQEAEIKRIVEETGAELVVLARYMQILSDDMTHYLAAASTSTIPSCPASRARSPITRRSRAG